MIEHTGLSWGELRTAISFIYFDSDFYEAASTTFSYLILWPSIGEVRLFDKYGNTDWLGEAKVADEFLEKKGFFGLLDLRVKCDQLLGSKNHDFFSFHYNLNCQLLFPQIDIF